MLMLKNNEYCEETFIIIVRFIYLFMLYIFILYIGIDIDEKLFVSWFILFYYYCYPF